MKNPLLPLVLLASAPLAQNPGQVLSEHKLSKLGPNPVADIELGDQFGIAVGRIGDLDGDGVVDVAVGAWGDDDPLLDTGAVYILRLNQDGTIKAQSKISASDLSGKLDEYDVLGTAVDGLGDVDGDGVLDIAVGAWGDDDGGLPSTNGIGAVWIFFMKPDGDVKAVQKISALEGGFVGPLEYGSGLGDSVCALGDLDGDGTPDLAVGVYGHDGLGNGRGAIYLLYLNPDGTVKAQQEISEGVGGFGGTLTDGDGFGRSIAKFDDLNGDGFIDLAVGAYGSVDGEAVWILNLDASGLVQSEQRISALSGGFTGALDDNDHFGRYVSVPGDVDGDGVDDLAVGAIGDDDTDVYHGDDYGAVWILFMNPDGTVKGHQKIGGSDGGLVGPLDKFDWFGAVAPLGDLDGDGALDLLVGSRGDDDGLANAGAAYVLFLQGQASSQPYGCGVNPPGSLVELSGSPAIGTTWTLGVQDPLGGHPAGSAAYVAVSTAPDPAYPCGTLVTGYGMGSAVAQGEQLIAWPAAVLLGPVAWGGVGTHAALPLAIPSAPTLIGLDVFLQGALVDFVLGVGLTEALQATITS